jgi:hypothetical protein
LHLSGLRATTHLWPAQQSRHLMVSATRPSRYGARDRQAHRDRRPQGMNSLFGKLCHADAEGEYGSPAAKQ